MYPTLEKPRTFGQVNTSQLYTKRLFFSLPIQKKQTQERKKISLYNLIQPAIYKGPIKAYSNSSDLDAELYD